MTNTTSTAPGWATIYCSSAIFLFGLLALIIPSGYSIGAGLLLLGGIYAYTQDRHTVLNRRDFYLLLVLFAFTLEGVISNLWHGLNSSNYDKVLRFALAIPAFYLIRWTKPKSHWVWLGLVSGSILTALLAVYEKLLLGIERASGFNHPIQFGNLAILMGLFCLAGLGWATSLSNSAQRRFYSIALLLGAISGLFASMLSGSRGGWIGLPFVLLVLFKAYHCLFSLRTKIIGLVFCLITAIAIFYVPHLPVKERFQEAVSDVQQYQAGNKATSVGARFEMWRGALQIIKEKPLLGWGQAEYLPAMKNLVNKEKIDPAALLFNHPHNEVLDKFAKQGLLGLLTLMTLYIAPIWYFSPYLKHHNLSIRAVAVAGTILPVAYIDFGLTQGFLSHNSGVMMYAFWLIIWAGYLRNAITAYSSPRTAPAATVL